MGQKYIIIDKLFKNDEYEMVSVLIGGEKKIIKRINRKHKDFTYLYNLMLLEFEHSESKNFENECLVPEKIYSTNTEGIIIYRYENVIPLSEYIPSDGMKINKFLKYAILICNKLLQFHKKDIHGYLNPMNILICEDKKEVFFHGNSYEVDILEYDMSSLETKLIGYISPEQTGLFESTVDYKSDLYSLGMVFYKMILGYSPFEKDPSKKIIYNHVTKNPIEPHELRKDLPKSVSEIIMKLIQKSMKNRYETAHGVKKDLEYLMKSNFEGNIEVGQFDIPCRLNFSNDLFNRKNELDTMLDIYNRAIDGKSYGFVIEGESGVGKSSLLREFLRKIKDDKPIIIDIDEHCVLENDDNFLIRNVLDQMLFYCLINEDIVISEIREAITDIAKDSAADLVELVPRIKSFVDEKLLQGHKKCPLIKKSIKYVLLEISLYLTNILLDSQAKLIVSFDIKNKYKKNLKDILKRLIRHKKHGSMMIIETTNPGIVGMIEGNWKKEPETIECRKIELKGLRVLDIAKILQKTFYLKESEIKEIARVILVRTSGNPFLVKEYILKLYKSHGIYFEYNRYKWEIDTEKIHDIKINSDINEFLKEKYFELPKEVKSILKVCACLHNEFDSKVISDISGYSVKTVRRIFGYCKRNRLIKEKDRLNNIQPINLYNNSLKKYNFESRRFKIIIQRTMSDKTKAKYRYIIGNYYLKNDNNQKYNWFVLNCFMNTGALPKEHDLLNKLDQMIMAKCFEHLKSGCYEEVVKISEKGDKVRGILNDKSRYYQAIKALALYRLGNIDEAEEIAITIERQLKDVDSNLYVKLRTFRIEGHVLNGQFDKAEEIIFETLGTKCLVKRVRNKKTFMSILSKLIFGILLNKQYVNRRYKLFLKDISEEVLKGFTYMAAMTFSYTNVYRFLCTTFVDIALVGFNQSKTRDFIRILKKYYGFVNNDMSSVMEITVFEQFANSIEFEHTVTEINKNCLMGCNGFVFTKDSERKEKEIELLLKNMLRYNENLYFLYVLQFSLINDLSRGESVDNIIGKIGIYEFKLKEYLLDLVGYIFEVRDILKNCVKGNQKVPKILHGDTLTVKTIKVFSMFVKKDYNNIDVLLETNIDEYNFNNTAAILEYGFYKCLVIAECSEKMSIEQKNHAKKEFNQILKAYKKLHKSENSNLRSKYIILKCYKNYMNGRYDEVLKLGCKINEICTLEKFSLGSAISHEVCAIAFVKKNLSNFANIHFNQCKKIYNKLSISSNAGNSNNFAWVHDKQHLIRLGLNDEKNKYNNIREVLDDLNKLGGEKSFDALVDKIIEINLKCMKAERVVFFNIEKNNVKKIREGMNNGGLSSFELPVNQCIDIPKTVINFVMKTKKRIVINEAKNNQLFYFDKYILKNNVKSIACYPIMEDQKIKAIIYIENKKYSRCFLKETESIIELIACNVGISLSNVNQYNKITEKRLNLESLIQEKSKELKEVEERLVKEVEEKLLIEKKLNKSKEKTEYFANLSHEFKTPLNVILSTIQLIEVLSENNYDNKVRDYLKIMKQNCYRLLRLVNNIIDLSKIDEGYMKLDMKHYNIIRIIEDICMSVVCYAQNKEIDLIFDTEEEDVSIFCDEEKIERIILNILSNAIKFTDRNGKIKVNINITGDFIVISIKDNGIGIHKEVQDKIFGRFEQADKSLSRKQEGSGIGLALSKQLVEMQGGSVDIISEYGMGSEFIIRLPIDSIEYKEIEDDNREKITSNHNFVEKIKIEFSDIYF